MIQLIESNASAGTKFYSKCGSQITADIKFCKNCGNEVNL
ncbi:MAG: zinc-ribbon domain-containing protein [Promethearchaeota archaeon]